MSGLINNGLPQQGPFTGAELLNMDTQLPQGIAPQSSMSSLIALAVAIKWANTHSSKTTVAGTRYYVSVVLGTSALITGVDVLVGTTGGTDNWIVELHNASGVLVATSATAGTTAGTANAFQRIAFTAPYQAAAGTYYIALQSNGTTATPAVFSSTGISGIVTGSATGTFGTGAAITPPTTYAAALGPLAHLY